VLNVIHDSVPYAFDAERDLAFDGPRLITTSPTVSFLFSRNGISLMDCICFTNGVDSRNMSAEDVGGSICLKTGTLLFKGEIQAVTDTTCQILWREVLAFPIGTFGGCQTSSLK